MLIYISLCLVGCTDAATKPDHLIAPEPFIDVLVDVRLLEGAYASRVSRPDTIGPNMAGYYDAVFEKHQVTRQQFFTSYEYYLRQHELMISMENSVIEKLSAMHVDQSEIAKPLIVADSLRSDSLRRARILEREAKQR